MHYAVPGKITEQQERSCVLNSYGLPVSIRPVPCVRYLSLSLFSYPNSPEIETDPGALWYWVSGICLWAHHQGNLGEHCLWRLLQVSPTLLLSRNFPWWARAPGSTGLHGEMEAWPPSFVRKYFHQLGRNITWLC